MTGAGFSSRPWSAAVRRQVDGFSPVWLRQTGEPGPATVAALARELRERRVGTVVGVGGGSVLDLAKSAARLAGEPAVDAESVIRYCTGVSEPRDSPVRIIAVPTTAGTGAEVTPFATVWERAGNRKLSLSGSQMLPVAAVLDPDLLCGLSPRQLAGGLLDTLSQGIEAAWSARATEESVAYGLAAVRVAGPLLDRLRPGVPADLAVRAALQLAGHLSGRAIALANTTSVHALSYSLTLRAGLPHGPACGAVLGRMIRYNAAVGPGDCADPRGPGRVREVIDQVVGALRVGDAVAAEQGIDAFLARHDLPGLDQIDCDTEELAREALTYARTADNPRQLDAGGLGRLLRRRRAEEDQCE